MTTKTVSAVSLEVLENDRKFANSVIGAYRSGATRAIDYTAANYDKLLYGKLAGYAPKVAGVLNDNFQKAVKSMSSGIEKLSNGADTAVDKICDAAVGVVNKASSVAESVENPYVLRYLNVVRQVALPPMQLTRKFTGAMVATGERLYTGTKGTKSPKAKKPVKTQGRGKVRGKARAKAAA